MKNLITIILAVLSIGLVSCTGDDSSNEKLGGEEFIKFTYNDKQFNFEPSSSIDVQRFIFGSEEKDGVFTELTLWMPENAQIGTFDLTNEIAIDETNADLYSARLVAGDKTFISTSGTFTITSFNEELYTFSGTFSFTAANEDGETVNVSNGTFTASY